MTDIVEKQEVKPKSAMMMMHDAEKALEDGIHLKEMSVRVDVEMEQLRLARVDEDFARLELEKVCKERDDFLQQTTQGRHIMQKLDNLTVAKDLAKTVTKTRYEQIRDTLLSHAKSILSKGGLPWGRGFHANAQVQKGVELSILDIVKAVTWLQLVGMEEVVNISLRKNTGFFRNAKPPAGSLELLEIPTIKIDKVITPPTAELLMAAVLTDEEKDSVHQKMKEGYWPETMTGSGESFSPDDSKDDVPPTPDGQVTKVDIDLAQLETDMAKDLSLLASATRSETEEEEESAAVRKALGGGDTRRVE